MVYSASVIHQIRDFSGAYPEDMTQRMAEKGNRFASDYLFMKLREQDLNLRPSGYEPDELPDCSIPRYMARLFCRAADMLLL